MLVNEFDGISIFVDEPYDEKDFMDEFNTPDILESTSLEYPIKKESFSENKVYSKEGEERFILKRENKIIGSADLYNIEENHKATLRYWIAKSEWGKGIATKMTKIILDFCFSKLNLIRVDAYVFENNIGSKRVLEKSGFVQEGFLKNYDKKGDQFINEYIFAAHK